MQWQTKLPLIAILRGIKPDEALAHVGAVIDAGFDAVEIPLNSPQWEKSIPQVVDAYGEQALIGAGTVLLTFEQPMPAGGGELSPGEVRPLDVQAERGFIQIAHSCAVRALHIVGVNFQLRLRIHLRQR